MISENGRILAESVPTTQLEVLEGENRNLEIEVTSVSPGEPLYLTSENAGTPFASFPSQVDESSSKIRFTISVHTDDNCEEEERSILIRNSQKRTIRRLNLAIREIDKCLFFANNGGNDFTGNLGGIAGADQTCASSKSEFLPGSSSEYKAVLFSMAAPQRKSGNMVAASADWPVVKNRRYYFHSNDVNRYQLFFQTAVESRVGDNGGIFGLPSVSSVPPQILPNPAVFWTGFESTFSSGSTCNGWTSSDGDDIGLSMNSNFHETAENCNERKKILCVRI
ncbi:DUF1554 domain-containing protein [Leptospira sp. FAT2]|uniref:DUF1554 domain-containing protein n=1 Tax=Leptospira sanjuanensis TaxID=2879643 RepID=UPI001EE922D8|nr:DUF1554 domain-containing protein [Leptospira sanjuanensis]MCG6193676.1 DUF1554 domain-containing protein [Leptospira sanjuanensis]